MVTFLTTSKAYATIEEIIDKATTKVVLISPYIRISDQLFDRLKHKDRQGIGITVVCRGKDLDAEEKGRFRQLKHLELRFDEDLHAKCFYNEKLMVITSLNLYDYSRQHNREMGILLSSDEDSDIFKEALGEVKFIVDNAEKDSTIRNIVRDVVKEAKKVIDSPAVGDVRKVKTSSRAKTSSRTKQEGHCIRCNKGIPYDIDKPYCLPCARLWNKFGGNGDYKEKYCHQCGKKISTTYNSPRCGSCYWGH